ncbi:MAG: hypothetical protein ACI9R3_000141 [Verrucomicrobiales bacterium]|jgi:hypothetical protein
MSQLLSVCRVVALLVCCFVLSASAQSGVTVRANLSPAMVTVGQEGTYKIIVNGVGKVDTFPRKIDVDGLEVIFKLSGLSFFIEKGRSVQRTSLTYSVSAQREGKFKIPAQAVGVGRSSYQTNEVTLLVRPGLPDKEREKPTLKIEIPQSEIFVGEVIPIALVVEVPAGSQFRPMEHPKFNPEGFAVKRFEVPVPGGQRDGWGEYRYESSLSAISAGKRTLAPAELAFSVSSPPQRTGRTPFLRGWKNASYRLKTEPIEITVKPLPTEGMPADFQGAVGKFTMNVTASPTELQVNAPMVIDARIVGMGNFDRLTAPELTDLDGWKLQRPREYLENRSNGLQRGTTAFSQVVQPLRLMEALPPLQFSYFDPESASYTTLRSDPIALTIVAEENQSTRVDGKDFTTPEASVPEEELGDILTIFQRPGDLLRVDGDDAPVPVAYRSVVTLSMLTVIGIAAFGCRRILKERKRASDRVLLAGKRRSSAVVLEELADGGLPSKEFYALAGECVDSIAAESGVDVNILVQSSDDLLAVRGMVQFYHYGASAGKAAEAVNSSEREHVVQSIRSLIADKPKQEEAQ